MLRDSQTGLYNEEFFNELLALEKKRCEDSKDPVCLITADLSSFVDIHERQKITKSMADALSNVTRDTDIKGWHVDGLVMGIMFTEMTGKEATSPFAHVVSKCIGSLAFHLGMERLARIQISWQRTGNGKWERPYELRLWFPSRNRIAMCLNYKIFTRRQVNIMDVSITARKRCLMETGNMIRRCIDECRAIGQGFTRPLGTMIEKYTS
jgi:hypothetical protein